MSNLTEIIFYLMEASKLDADKNLYTEHYECFGLRIFMRSVNSTLPIEQVLKNTCQNTCKPPHHLESFKYVYCDNCPLDRKTRNLKYIQ